MYVFRAHQGDDHQGQQNAGKGGQGVVQAHQHIIHNTAKVPGEGAGGGAEDGADENRQNGDEEGGPRPLHHAGEDIPAKVVRPEGVLETGGQVFFAAGHGGGGVGGPDRSQEEGRGQKTGNGKARQEEAVHLLFHRVRNCHCL